MVQKRSIKNYPQQQNKEESTYVSRKEQRKNYRDQQAKLANQRRLNADDTDTKTSSDDYDQFVTRLRSLDVYIHEIVGDGNCLFRSVADQLYNDQERHRELRTEVTNYMRNHRTFFEPFVSEDQQFLDYINEMSHDGVWGGHLELYGCARRFDVAIRIYQQNGPAFLVEPEEQEAAEQRRTIQLGYLNGSHYVSVRPIAELGIAAPRQTRRSVELTSELKNEKIGRMQKRLGVENQKIIIPFLESANYSMKQAISLFQENQIKEMEELLNEPDLEQIKTALKSCHWDVDLAVTEYMQKEFNNEETSNTEVNESKIKIQSTDDIGKDFPEQIHERQQTDGNKKKKKISKREKKELKRKNKKLASKNNVKKNGNNEAIDDNEDFSSSEDDYQFENIKV